MRWCPILMSTRSIPTFVFYSVSVHPVYSVHPLRLYGPSTQFTHYPYTLFTVPIHPIYSVYPPCLQYPSTQFTVSIHPVYTLSVHPVYSVHPPNLQCPSIPYTVSMVSVTITLSRCPSTLITQYSSIPLEYLHNPPHITRLHRVVQTPSSTPYNTLYPQPSHRHTFLPALN